MLLKVTENLKSILEKDSITSKEFEEIQEIRNLCRKIDDKFIFDYTFNKKHSEKNVTDLPKERWGFMKVIAVLFMDVNMVTQIVL